MAKLGSETVTKAEGHKPVVQQDSEADYTMRLSGAVGGQKKDSETARRIRWEVGQRDSGREGW